MGTSIVAYFTCLLLLLTLTKVHGGPVYSSMISSDLSDLKGLLERLEDKLPAEEPEVPAQDLFMGNYDSLDSIQSSNSAPSWPGEGSRPPADLGYNRGSWAQPDRVSPLKNKLRELLNAPRSMRRSSDCFGSRIDRIGAQSGMGCGRRFSRESEAQNVQD
ncbi:natriuretic peptides A-like [Hyla sarda]|uniref:natriuretic peptides A-like n=1 Tax=Hyla sarda TaxID=327740 RepID=UPI0024C39C73|nr:natriuretic peptides A-like [Hyla sarda]